MFLLQRQLMFLSRQWACAFILMGLLWLQSSLNPPSVFSETKTPSTASDHIYIGTIQGFPDETEELRRHLQNVLKQAHYHLSETPSSADFLLLGNMGARDVWGDYTRTKSNKVLGQLELINTETRQIKRAVFTKPPHCSASCYQHIAKKWVKSLILPR